jgi:transposase
MPRRTPDPALEKLWRDRLDRFHNSGLSVRAFCARERLPESAFYFWKRQLAARDAQAQPAQPAFVPVRVLAAPPSSPLEVVLAAGRIIRVPPGFDPALLRAVLAALEEDQPC